MKKLTIITAAATIIILFFTNCLKNIINQYEGTWDFVTVRTYQGNQFDTIYYTGYVKGGMYKDKVEIGYTEYDYIFLKINASGEIFSKNGVYVIGQFDTKDKVHFQLGRDEINGMRMSQKQ